MPIENQEQEINTTSLAAEIAGGLLADSAPEQEQGGGAEESPEGVVSSPAAPEPESAAPAPSAPADEFASAPSSWKKEMAAHWQALSPEVRQYLRQREEEYTRGVSSYKQGHESWNQLLSPFQQVLQQYPGVNPVQLAQQTLAGHIALSTAPAEQKLQLAARMLRSYGIDPAQLLGQAGAPQAPAGPDPALMQRLQAIERNLYEEKLSATTKQVESFFADSKNKYAKDLEGDILQMIQSGKAASLEEAYQTALWLNPATRAKVIADQQKEAAEAAAKEAEKQRKAESLNIGRRDNSRAPVGRKLTIEDTINSVVAKNYGT